MKNFFESINTNIDILNQRKGISVILSFISFVNSYFIIHLFGPHSIITTNLFLNVFTSIFIVMITINFLLFLLIKVKIIKN